MASDLDIVGSNGLRVDKYAHTEIVGIQASLTGNQTISPLEGVFEKVPIDPAIIEEAFGTDGLSDEDGVVLRYGSLNLENEEATSPIYYSQITYDQIIKSLESTQFTKGQTFGESPDVCSDGSCIDTLRFAILGPTIINLQFFDHFGQYINRYSQVVTQSQLDSAYREQGLMEVVGGVEYPRQPYVAISPNIIPVDQYGRSWGSHPIIVQLDMIELPPETCFVKDAAKNLNCDLKVTGQPNRTIKSFLIGYRRINDGAGVALTP